MNRFHTSKTHFQVRGSLRHVGAGTATLALLVIAMLVAPQSARGQALTVLHTFAGGTDGASPSELAGDSEGNLYGITSSRGASNLGKVFKLDPTGIHSVLYSFSGGTDGANPSSLMRDGSVRASTGPPEDWTIPINIKGIFRRCSFLSIEGQTRIHRLTMAIGREE